MAFLCSNEMENRIIVVIKMDVIIATIVLSILIIGTHNTRVVIKHATNALNVALIKILIISYANPTIKHHMRFWRKPIIVMWRHWLDHPLSFGCSIPCCKLSKKKDSFS